MKKIVFFGREHLNKSIQMMPYLILHYDAQSTPFIELSRNFVCYHGQVMIIRLVTIKANLEFKKM